MSSCNVILCPSVIVALNMPVACLTFVLRGDFPSCAQQTLAVDALQDAVQTDWVCLKDNYH